MAPAVQPAPPPLSTLTQQGGGVREHDAAAKQKAEKVFHSLLAYLPFVEMIASQMDPRKGITGLSVQLGFPNKLLLNVQGVGGASARFTIGKSTAQGFEKEQGIDQKIFEAAQFILNPSKPDAVPPDFDPPAAAPQPPGAAAAAAPQPPGAAAAAAPQPPGAAPAAAPQPPLPIPPPADDPETERFNALQTAHKEGLEAIFASQQPVRNALFTAHDGAQAALPAASRAITRDHKELLQTFRKEMLDLQGRHEQQMRDLLEDRQGLEKDLSTRHLEAQRTAMNQVGADVLGLLAQQLIELEQQKQETVELFRGLHQQHRDEWAVLFQQQVPRQAPLSAALRGLLGAQATRILRETTANQGRITTVIRRQQNQRIQIQQTLQQAAALSSITDVIIAIGISNANPAQQPASMIAQAEREVLAAQTATDEARASRDTLAIGTLAYTRANARFNAADTARVLVIAARDQIRAQATLAESAYRRANGAPSRAAAQANAANAAKAAAQAQLATAQTRSKLAQNAAANAKHIALADPDRIQRERNWKRKTRAAAAAAALYGVHYMWPSAIPAVWSAAAPRVMDIAETCWSYLTGG
jgi:hypothetical protein